MLRDFSSVPLEPFEPDETWKRALRRRLLTWFRSHARDLPWRRTRDPYAIWISEVMLQQTQIATVIPYFQRFLAAFPDVHALAAASEQEVLRHWEGLGYYRRARQLHQAARVIATHHGGEIPRDPAVLRSLPGIGRYTAGAILSIAHDDCQPILEANTLRLLSRLLAYRGDPRSAAGQALLWSFAATLVPPRQAGTFNQALMEMGSLICRPVAPDCGNCPAAALCPTRERGWQDRVPAPTKKPRYETVREAALVVWHGRRLLVRQCQTHERWAGLWDFPRFTVPDGIDNLADFAAQCVASQTGITARVNEPLATLRYGVTRFRIKLDCYQARYAGGRPRDASVGWWEPAALAELPLSVTGRKISQLLLPQ